MKPLFLITCAFAALPARAADPQPFAPISLQLSSPIIVTEMRLDIPIGPIKVAYSVPLRSGVDPAPKRNLFLDAPGAGYREQRSRANKK